MNIIAAILFIIVAVSIFVFVGIKGQRERIEVFLDGETVTATITSIEQQKNTSFAIPVPRSIFPLAFSATRYLITAEWKDVEKDKTYTFTSNPLTELPENMQVGDPIAVKIDARNPERYLVEAVALQTPSS